MNVRMRSEPKGFVILLLSLCYRYLELILCLWLNASMLLKYFNKEPGRSKVFHSNNWLGIILLHFSDINILEDIKHVHLTNWSLFNYLCLLKFIFQCSGNKHRQGFLTGSVWGTSAILLVYMFAELRKCLYMKLLPRNVCKDVCGLWQLRLQLGTAGRSLALYVLVFNMFDYTLGGIWTMMWSEQVQTASCC